MSARAIWVPAALLIAMATAMTTAMTTALGAFGTHARRRF